MRRPAFTIAELLVTMALTLIVFDLAYQIMLPSLRIWVENQANGTLEETGLVLEARIIRELEQSTSISLAVTPPPVAHAPPALEAFSFATLGGEDAPDGFSARNGQPAWQGYILYFIPPGSHTVYRKQWPVPGAPVQTPLDQYVGTGGLLVGTTGTPPPGVTPATSPYAFPNPLPAPLSLVDLQTICGTVNGSERAMGSLVTLLQVQQLPIPVQTVTQGDRMVQIKTQSYPNGLLTLQLQTASPVGTVSTEREQQFMMRQ